MSALLVAGLAVPGFARPIQSIFRRILVQAFPPYGVVVQVVSYVGEDGALTGRGQCIGVGLFVGARRHAEEAVFGVDGIQAAIFTLPHPSDVVADSPNFVTLHAIAFRRDHHSQVGLAASGRESSGHVLDFALGIFNAQNQHVFSHPAFVLALIGSDTQSKALFAQQHVSAVAGVHADDRVVFREVADISLFFVNIALAVQAFYPVGAVAQHIPHSVAHTGHDRHIQNHVNGVGQLYANFGQRRTDGAHGVGDHVHGTALVASAGDIIQHFISFLRVHPVVGGAGLFLGVGTDERSAFHAGHVVYSRAVQVAAGQLFFVELDHFAGLAGFGAQRFELLFRAVDPNELIRINESFHLVDPSEHTCILCHDFLLLPAQWPN